MSDHPPRLDGHQVAKIASMLNDLDDGAGEFQGLVYLADLDLEAEVAYDEERASHVLVAVVENDR